MIGQTSDIKVNTKQWKFTTSNAQKAKKTDDKTFFIFTVALSLVTCFEEGNTLLLRVGVIGFYSLKISVFFNVYFRTTIFVFFFVNIIFDE